MESSFRCILLRENHEAQVHWDKAETFRMAAETLSTDQATPAPPTRLSAVRVLIEETPDNSDPTS
jgi:hypothetical protein